MLDEMTNPVFINFLLDNEDATENDCESADRLMGALEEIDRLVAERNRLLCELHQKIEAARGNNSGG